MYADISVTIRRATWRQLLTGAAAVLFILAAVAALAAWHAGDVRLLSVQTSSMEPSIEPGDAVLVRPVDIDDLAPGDIISFHSPAGQGITITHRVVDIDRRYGMVTTQGDANADSDRPVGERDIVGRAEQPIANLGYLIDAARSPAGLALGVYLPAALIARGELRRLTDYYRPAYRHPLAAGTA